MYLNKKMISIYKTQIFIPKREKVKDKYLIVIKVLLGKIILKVFKMIVNCNKIILMIIMIVIDIITIQLKQDLAKFSIKRFNKTLLNKIIIINNIFNLNNFKILVMKKSKKIMYSID